ncbi:hypothetical protein Halru_2405 [Halovivax ruber XH-70]|uniref:Uncharacterized protein n=1 Tax=Halovivax ruber (strain DSM 18193 / JCM 13892 / XH-70) TaxID=797302 RepID=L0IE03_HALRX|nr:hypothetical protein [Halovivax ruber]AGB16989.1 hypothetical protein Halru_2405 [Halovivax ruber XH-70]
MDRTRRHGGVEVTSGGELGDQTVGDSPNRRTGSAEPTGGTNADRSIGGHTAALSRDDNDASEAAVEATLPAVDPGDAIRIHDPAASIAVLWPTEPSVDHPFVSVLTGRDGTRYPLYVDADSAASHCRGSYSIVPADSVPIDPPPHAATAADAR